jgi:hypothetical protein
METLRAKYGDKLGKLMAIAPTLTLVLATLMGTATATQASSRERLNVFDLQAQVEQGLTQSLDSSILELYAHSTDWAAASIGWVDGNNDSIDERAELILANSNCSGWCCWFPNFPACNGGGNGGPWNPKGFL